MNVPLTSERLLLAVEEAHDTLLAQMIAVLQSLVSNETLTIQDMAQRLGFDLTRHQDTLTAHRFFIDTAKEAFRYAGYTAADRKPTRRRK